MRVLLVLVLVLGGTSQAHAAVSFAPPDSYPVGSAPRSIAVGDFNGDHDLDLAVANEFSDDVSVLLGGPGGSFGAQTSYPVGGFPQDVAAGDFNGDGDPDLAVTRGNAASILLGGPGGTFGEPTSYQVVPRATGIAVGDFNGDLDPDLAVTHLEPSNSITVLRGKAGGTFRVVQATYPVGGRNPVSVALDDFDEDGLLDVVTANEFSDNLSVLLGTGGGAFGTPVTYQAGERSDEVVVGDFNGDGDPDLATANDGAHNTSVRLGLPGGSFTKQAKYPVSPPASSIALADFDLDDHLDLAFHSLGISVLRGGGDGTFGAQTSFPGGGIALAVGDFNADGHPDLAGAIYAGGTVSVSLNAWVGVDPSDILWEPRPDRTESEFRTATLENHTGVDLAVGGVGLAGPDASSFQLQASSDECTGTTVPDGGSCTVRVRFRPIGVGSKSASLVFSHDGPGSPQAVALAGTGTPGPWLERSVQALEFGQTPVGSGATPAKTVTLTNVGSAPLTITGITKGGANPTDFRNLTQTCTAMGALDPGESCEASIAFRPTATGLRTAHLTITDTAPRSPHRVGLSGTGI